MRCPTSQDVISLSQGMKQGRQSDLVQGDRRWILLLTQAACPVLPNPGRERLLFHLIHLQGLDFFFFFFF